MAPRTVVHPSKHYPKRLELLTKGMAAAPDLDRAAEGRLIRLGPKAFRVLRARINKRRLESLIKEMREEILPVADEGIYGFVVRSPKRAIQVLLSRRTIKTITDTRAFIEHLGPNVSDVVEGIVIPLAALVKSASDYAGFVELIEEQFGADVVAQIQLKINRDRLNELVSSGEIEATDHFFKDGEGPIQVDVKLI